MIPGRAIVSVRSAVSAVLCYFILTGITSCTEDSTEPVAPIMWTTIQLRAINEITVLKNETIYLKAEVTEGKRYIATLLQSNSDQVHWVAGYEELKGMPIFDGTGGLMEFTTDASGNALYFKISGNLLTTPNAQMVLMIHEYYRASNEINQEGPVTFNVGACYVGTVGSRGQSVYEVDNLISGAEYYITLFTLTGSADLFIYTDATYTFYIPSTRIISDITNQPEEYYYQADSSGKIYLKVHCGPLNREGATFKILVRRK
jgi:hypothetical protein